MSRAPLAPHTAAPKYKLIRSAFAPTVSIDPEALARMALYVGLSADEVGWLGTVTRTPSATPGMPDGFRIDQVFMLEQGANAGTTEIDPEAIGTLASNLMTEDNGSTERLEKLLLWGHSHVNMATNPSAQDDTQMATFQQNNPPFMLRLIANKSGKISLDIYDYTDGIVWNDVAWRVDYPEIPNLQAEVQAELVEKVRKIVYAYTPASTYRAPYVAPHRAPTQDSLPLAPRDRVAYADAPGSARTPTTPALDAQNRPITVIGGGTGTAPRSASNPSYGLPRQGYTESFPNEDWGTPLLGTSTPTPAGTTIAPSSSTVTTAPVAHAPLSAPHAPLSAPHAPLPAPNAPTTVAPVRAPAAPLKSTTPTLTALAPGATPILFLYDSVTMQLLVPTTGYPPANETQWRAIEPVRGPYAHIDDYNHDKRIWSAQYAAWLSEGQTTVH